MKKKLPMMVAGASAALLALTGCSAGGTEDGGDTQLNIYAWANEIPQEVIDAFTEETGIEVTLDTFDANETMISKLSAGAEYDIVEPSQYAVAQMIAQDLIVELDHSRIEGLDNLLPSFQDPEFDPGNTYSVPWVWGATGILYNEDCFDAPVTSWETMFDPAYSGKLYMQDNMMAAYVAGLQLNGFSANSTDEDEVAKATESLLAQKEILAGYNATNYPELVSSGQACAAQAYSGSAVAQAVAANEKLHYVQPSEGGTMWVDSFAISADAPHVDAAYEWINFTLRPEIAAMVTDFGASATTNEPALAEVQDQSLVTNEAIFVPQDSLVDSEFLVDPGTALQYRQNGWQQVRSS